MHTILTVDKEKPIIRDRQKYDETPKESQVAWEGLLSKADAPRPTKRIIIIDDEPKIRALFARALEQAGYETVTFGDNAPAIRYLNDSSHPIDLMVLDLNMPHVEGTYFTKILKMRHPSAKTLIASNYGIDLQKYIILNADGYFDKSEGIKALEAKVKKVLFTG